MSNKGSLPPKAAVRESAGGILAVLVLVCFFFSGVTGLIYEILWTRMIVKVIGCAPFAVSIILTVFMAGLGLGSYIAGRTIDKVKEPGKLVRLYGILEIIVGCYCFILSALLAGFRPVYAILYNRLFEHFMLYSFLTFICCAVLLIVPVICMGATLPILCRFYVTRLSHISSHAGRLYGLNTIGAAVGALVCGFWLIDWFGVPGTMLLAVTANLIIGAVSIFISYRVQGLAASQPARSEPQADAAQASIYRGAALAALVVFAVSGFCSMSYEVIWTKLLGLIIGPTTYSFTIVLVTFITALALGSMFFGWLGDRTKQPVWLLIGTQLAAAIFAIFVSHILGNSQFFFAKLIYQFQKSFALLNITKAAAVFVFMLPATILLGATFPLVGKIYTTSASRVGRSLGSAYAINTIGCVLGSFCAGFVLIPLLGKENGLRLVIAFQLVVSIGAGTFLALRNGGNGLRWITAAIFGVLGLAVCLRLPSWNKESLASGKYYRQVKAEELVGSEIESFGWVKALTHGSEFLAGNAASGVIFSSDGIAGFVAVLRRYDLFGNTDYSLLISGKGDASSDGDMATQTLSAHIPMIFHPNPKSVMVLGHASGITAGEALCYPIDRLDILEISRDVVEASRFFEPWNSNVLSNPKTNLIVQDGRAHLQLTNRRYDVIISEPSNPWMAGLAALFTRDFFVLARDRLNPDGIFTQFFHSYQMDWRSFAMICRCFSQVFPTNALIRTKSDDFLLVGFKGQKGLSLEIAQKNLRFAQNSRNIRIPGAKALYGLVVNEDIGFLAGPGPVHTDAQPRLEFAAPKVMFLDDPTIQNNVRTRRTVTPATQRIFQEASLSFDLQMDFATMLLSVNNQYEDMVNLARAGAEQKERFFSLMEEYASRRALDYSIIKDEQLLKRCRAAQIRSIESKLPGLADKAIAYYTLADLYRQNGLLAEAETNYLKAIELGPDYAEMHNDLAVVLHLQGRLAEAIAHYDEALRLRPNYPGAQRNRDKALAQQREKRLPEQTSRKEGAVQ